MYIEAWRLGCPDEQHFKQTFTVSPGPPVMTVNPVLTPPTNNGFHINTPWQARNVTDFRIRAILMPAKSVVFNKNNFGTVVQGQEDIALSGDAEGTVIVRATACAGLSQEVPIKLMPTDCEKDCQKDDCKEMPDCKGDPVHTLSRNMRYADVDPLPLTGEFPFRRTYQSRSGTAGYFGPRWFSMFDASLTDFLDTFDNTRYVSIYTEDHGQLLFSSGGGTYVQISAGGPLRGTLVKEADGTWTQTDGGGRRQRVFSATGLPLAFVDVTTGRRVEIQRDANNVPTRLVDSWGNWSLAVTTSGNPMRITKLTLEGTTTAWNYIYAGSHLERVDTPVGTWRRYTYAGYDQPEPWWRLTTVRDGDNNLVESHGYTGINSGEATSSYGPGGEIDSVTQPTGGRNPAEWKTTITYKNTRFEVHYRRWIAGEWRTVDVIGGCSTCGTRFASAVYDGFGNVIRAQDPNGYITEKTYDAAGLHVVATRNALRPSDCDPATAVNRCALTTDTLTTASLTETAATTSSTYRFEDSRWPHDVTTTETVSVMDATRLRRESVTYDSVTGQIATRTVRGWTGDTPREETRVHTTTLYTGTESAAFIVGGAFSSAWQSLPQPRFRKTVDGPRTDAADVTQYVYYPIHSTVTAELRGHLAAVRNPAGHITRFEDYDRFGNARSIVDANGVVQQRVFDSIGRLTATVVKGVAGCDLQADPLCNSDLTESRVFPGAGALQYELRPGGGVTEYRYDSRGRMSTLSRGPVSTDFRERIEYQYDVATGLRNAERILAADGGAWVEKRKESRVFDLFGRVARVEHLDGTFQRYEYDPLGNVVAVQDENHLTPNSTYTYDPVGRITEVRQTLGTGTVRTRYAYDRDGNVTSVTDPNGNVTSYVYDDLGQLLRQTSPVTGTTRYSYDVAGQLLTTSHDATANVTTRTYDVLGRALTTVSTMPGKSRETVTWSYDSGTFAKGRLTRMQSTVADSVAGRSSTITTDYGWERRGLLLTESQTINNEKYATSYRYDANGNRSRITYPSGRVVDYGYDFASRPQSATMGTTALVSTAVYLPFGPAKSMTFGNGTARTTTYDQRYRMFQDTLSGPVPAENGSSVQGTIVSHRYAYDPVGNIRAIDDLVDDGFHRQFQYDDLSRLTVANSNTKLWGNGSYSYDNMGNIRTTAVGANLQNFTMSGTTPKIASVTKDGRIDTVAYDALGNEVAAGARTYEYSARGSLSAAGCRLFAYDGRGLRTTTTYTISLSAFSLALTAAAANQTFSATVALNEPAPAGGLTVRLTSSSHHVSVPKKVTIAGGKASATFDVTVGAKANPGTVTLTATLATTLTATLNVVDVPPLATFSVTPVDVVGGTPVTASVTLSAPAPDGGAVIDISAESEAVAGAQIRIGGGATQGSATLTTYSVSSSLAVPLTATYGGSTLQTTLQLRTSSTPDRLLLTPNGVIGGEGSIGTITLSLPAAAGGRTFTLTTSNTNVASVPQSIAIAEGETSGTFAITTSLVSSSTSVTITATSAGSSLTAALIVACRVARAAAPSSFPAGQTVFVDDVLPPGAAITGDVNFEFTQAASGQFSLSAPYRGSGTYHAAIAGLAEPITEGEKLFAYALVS